MEFIIDKQAKYSNATLHFNNEYPIRKKIPNLFAFLQALKMPSVILINSTSFKIPGKYQQNVFEFLLGLLDYRVHLCK